MRIKTLQLKIHSTEQKIAEAKTADPNRTLELAQDKEQLALLQENAQLYQIKSTYSGKILELLVNPGDFLEPGKPVAWMEHIESADDPLVVYSFFPLERGKKLKKGDSIDIELSTVNSNEFGGTSRAFAIDFSVCHIERKCGAFDSKQSVSGLPYP